MAKNNVKYFQNTKNVIIKDTGKFNFKNCKISSKARACTSLSNSIGRRIKLIQCFAAYSMGHLVI